jgi:hypothetical protein
MASTTQKWLLGCGIGCGVVILLGLLTAGGGYLFVRSVFHGVQEVQESYEQLVAAHGAIEDWPPSRDGAVPPARMEIFLAVRDSLRGDLTRLDALLAEFPPDALFERGMSLKKVIETFRGLGQLVPPITDYLDQRNRLLLAMGMGPGEYTYIYSLSYYSFLGHAPDDGPVLTERGREGGRVRGDRLFDDDGTFGRPETWRRYLRTMLALLQNQLAALPATAGDPAAAAWRDELAEEVRRFADTPQTVAWAEGLPPLIAGSLGPYRVELEATYHAASNCFELAPRGEARWQHR